MITPGTVDPQNEELNNYLRRVSKKHRNDILNSESLAKFEENFDTNLEPESQRTSRRRLRQELQGNNIMNRNTFFKQVIRLFDY